MKHIKKMTELIIEKKSLVEEFINLHGDSIKNLEIGSLKNSTNTVDKEIYDAFHKEQDWKQLISEINSLKISNWHKEFLQQTKVQKVTQKGTDKHDVSILPTDEPQVEPKDDPTNDDWEFDSKVGYFYSLLPNFLGPEQSYKTSTQAFAVIDNKLTTQADIVDSQHIPFSFEM